MNNTISTVASWRVTAPESVLVLARLEAADRSATATTGQTFDATGAQFAGTGRAVAPMTVDAAARTYKSITHPGPPPRGRFR